jgi:hypothetical protein
MPHKADRFLKLDYLANGSAMQKQVYGVIKRHRLFEKLSGYKPLLAGTFPLDIAVAGSDLDVICTWQEAKLFKSDLHRHFASHTGFQLTETVIENEPTLIANFELDGWPVEVFGQAVPVTEQAAYRHMVVEDRLLQQHGAWFKAQIIALKQRGYKTEPAFGYMLQLPGNPYQALLNLYHKPGL